MDNIENAEDFENSVKSSKNKNENSNNYIKCN